MMTKYVVGFLFSKDKKNVILIKKTHPEWQKGKLNGVGGTIEKDEHPHECMIREFKEETGQTIREWMYFAKITNNKTWCVYFFRSFFPVEILKKCKTVTDEEIQMHFIPNNLPDDMINNLYWLIPMALSKDEGVPFYIKENHMEI